MMCVVILAEQIKILLQLVQHLQKELPCGLTKKMLYMMQSGGGLVEPVELYLIQLNICKW